MLFLALIWWILVVGTNFPQEQHTDLSDTANISFSYLLIEVRICKEEISGGNAWEAACCSLNSSLSKSKEIDIVSCVLLSSVVFFWIFWGWDMEWFVEVSIYRLLFLLGTIVGIGIDIEFDDRLNIGINCEEFVSWFDIKGQRWLIADEGDIICWYVVLAKSVIRRVLGINITNKFKAGINKKKFVSSLDMKG